MNTQQKSIIVILLAVVALNFGSLTKAKQIWVLAFSSTASDATSTANPLTPHLGSPQYKEG